MIELDWCSYDIEKRIVNAESSYSIKPKNLKGIDANLLSENEISLYQLESAEDIQQVLLKFNKFIYDNYTSKNHTIAFVTKDNSLLSGQLPDECTQKNIKLGSIFEKYINLLSEIKKFYKINDKEGVDLNDILQFLSLKQMDSSRPCLMELNTIARIVNRMIKDGYAFSSKGYYTHKSLKNQVDFPQISNDIKIKNFYIRLKNLPLYFNKKDIISMFYHYPLIEEDVAISYDIFGRKTGDVVVKMYNQSDHKEALINFRFRHVNTHLIECIESNEQDFMSCFESRVFLENPVVSGRNIFIKIKNIPYTAKESDIKVFFKAYYIAENGIKMLKNKKGNFMGEIVMAFIYEKETEKAIKEKNREMLLNQYNNT